jgi:hypothetical protein
MWNGWQLWNYNRDIARTNWDGHFFNPANNVNAFTAHLSTAKEGGARLQFYHSVVDGREELFAAQRAFFEKIIEETHDLDNIYYELVHELAMNYSDWGKTSAWIERMALAVRAKWRHFNPDRPIILGTDAGHLEGFPFNQSAGFPEPGSEMDWVFTRPYFDIMVYGNQHHAGNAREWRRHYRKPYIAQESRDDAGFAWGYRVPEMRHHLRKYLWKMMMVKCQQMDIYTAASGHQLQVEERPGHRYNFDPAGWNPFEDDALRLREFWNGIVDYPTLDFRGHFFISPVGHNFVLSSDREIIAYVSSPTGIEGYRYGPNGAQLRLRELPFPDGQYHSRFFDPKSGPAGKQLIRIRNGTANFRTPDFVDDFVVQILRAPSDG